MHCRVSNGTRSTAAEVRRGSSVTRLISVDYRTVLTEQDTCKGVPLASEQAAASRGTARELAALMKNVADDIQTELLKASAMSRTHDVCSSMSVMI